MKMSAPNPFSLLSLLFREFCRSGPLPRCPEPDDIMHDRGSVQAFHEQGENSLLPVYHFNALATSRLLPEGGTMVDLGSGSGQYISYLAACRPDARILGLDLSPAMVELGTKKLVQERLYPRVQLSIGDMTCFRDLIPGRVDVISSVFALHHLPDHASLERCFLEMDYVRRLYTGAVWIFDHARPKHPRTAEEFPTLFTPSAPESFQRDSRNSLLASFSFTEMSAALDRTFDRPVRHVLSRALRLYQAHWIEAGSDESHGVWKGKPLPPPACDTFRGLRRIMGGVPLQRTT
jgi:arsenite methyltransferase